MRQRIDLFIGRAHDLAAAREYDHRVRPEVLDRFHHLGACAFAHGYDHGKRGDADDDAEHHKKGPHLVHADRPHGELNCLCLFHYAALLSSLTILPSRILMIRLARCAISSECVTMTMVLPSL